jgi:hypothetical protein
MPTLQHQVRCHRIAQFLHVQVAFPNRDQLFQISRSKSESVSAVLPLHRRHHRRRTILTPVLYHQEQWRRIVQPSRDRGQETADREPGIKRVTQKVLELVLQGLGQETADKEPGIKRVTQKVLELDLDAADCSALVGAIPNIHPH